MWKAQIQAFWMSFTDIFNTRDDDAKGRTINLTCTLLASFYNVFITGIFYTGFLTMYGIDITGAGIITFIPYIANLLTIFSSRILSRFRQRKYVLIASKVLFYLLYIVATTIMPQFVVDPQARLIWFAVIMFVCHAVYAPFSPGFTVWFYRFYPTDNQRRSRYILLCQVFGSIMSTAILLFTSVLTDAIAGSPYQNTLILALRYLAFVLVLIECLIQVRAREYPTADEPRLQLKQVFTLPFRYRKFLYCVLLCFAWNYIANLNNGLWNYYLLNYMHFPYTLINAMSAMYTLILILTSGLWNKMIRRYSWVKTYAIALLCWVPTEFIYFMMMPGRDFIYIPMSIVQNILNVGINLSYANIFYMNLPEENSTAHVAFYTIGCNLFAFLGLMSGTWISSISGDSTMIFLGMETYSVLLTTLARGVTILVLGLVLIVKWRSFTRDSDIQEVETLAALAPHYTIQQRLQMARSVIRQISRRILARKTR